MRISKFLAATALTVAGASPALADDADGTWTGAYAGVSIGYTDAKSDQTVALSGAWTSESTGLQAYATDFYPRDSKVQNVNFGGQIGYNYQTASGLVLGLEADISAISGKESVARPLTATTPFPALSYAVTNTFDPKATYGLKAKLGFGSDNTLFYATGGWAWTTADLGVDITSNGGYHKTASVSRTFDGWQAGAGIEQRLGGNLSVRLDYNYIDQGKESFDTVYAPGSAFLTPAYNETFTQELTTHMVRVGINFHF